MNTPCDEPIIVLDEKGNEKKIYKCPYDEIYRNCCGLGVDE